MKRLVVEKDNLIHNINEIKQELDMKIIAVLKGNGYGLGIEELAKIFAVQGIGFFAVAEAEEAFALRAAGFLEQSILLLTPIHSRELLQRLLEQNIILTISSGENANAVDAAAISSGIIAKAHVKVDTGFGRFGIYASEKEELVRLFKFKNIDVQGMYSHFSFAFEKKYKHTKKQLEMLLETDAYLKSLGIDTGMLHIANSCAALRFPDTRLDAVRIGSAFLGRLPVKTVLSLKKIGFIEAEVLDVSVVGMGRNIGYANTFKTKRDTQAIVVDIGYKHGFGVEKSRDAYRLADILRYVYNDLKSYNKKIYMYLGQKPLRVLGRVGMHFCTVEGDSGIKKGDFVRAEVNPLFVDTSVTREYR